MIITSLDCRLAFRMLLKHRGLSLVCGVAIAFAIAVGAVFFELLTQALHPRLPLPGGDRIVGVRNFDAGRGRADALVAHDFGVWRADLRTVSPLAAFRTIDRNLALDRGAGEPASLAEITASGFDVARAQPLLGRALQPGDEAAGAPPVLVLSHALWTRRFDADPYVVGREVRIGDVVHEVVGVMPAGFGFPVAHEAWVPLRIDPLAYPPRQGPALQLVGRLADGASLADANAELATFGRRAAAASPATHAQLRPEALPLAESILPVRLELAVLAGAWSINLAVVLFALLVFANVAMLVFARTAAREAELVVRSALGATRRRIVQQLFAEALALGALGCAVGLIAADMVIDYSLATIAAQLEGALPFWFHAGLSLRTVLYAIGLTLIGTLVAGVLPALKVTRRDLHGMLQQTGAGSGGLRFGGVWTAVIVMQVALTIAFPLTVFVAQRDAARIRDHDSGVDAARFLTARVELDRYDATGAPADPQRIARVRAALERALEAEPAVAGATYGSQLPRMYHPWRRIDLDAGPVQRPHDGASHRVSGAWVAPDFFDTLGAAVLAGRGFRASEAAAGTPVVVVNERFVADVLGGSQPIGRRIRYRAADEPWRDVRNDDTWYEIVGVVPDMAMGEDASAGAGLYHPLDPRVSTSTDTVGAASVHLAIATRGDPTGFSARLQQIAQAVDPELRLYAVQPMERLHEAAVQAVRFWFQVLLLTSAVTLALSLAGIHAITGFTVTRRVREIGVRLALGARPAAVAAAALRRPLRQLAYGVAAGSVLGALFVSSVEGGWHSLSAANAALFAGYVASMSAICLLAALGPARRAMRVAPMAALRDSG